MTRKPILITALLLAATAAPAWADLPINTLIFFDFSNGALPQGLTLSADGTTFFGATNGGGAYGAASLGYGTLFSIPVGGGTPTVLTSFSQAYVAKPNAVLTLSGDGNSLYGTTFNPFNGVNNGSVFSIPVTGGTPTVLASTGGARWSSLTPSGNTFYSTAAVGGIDGVSWVSSVPITGGTPTTLASLSGSNDTNPVANLTLSRDGYTLYGTTASGGVSGYGTVFSVPITGGTSTILASFNGNNGQYPAGGLTLSADGSTLYGTTRYGGASYTGSSYSGYGTVFSLPITGGTPTVLASFDGTNGTNPWASVTFSGDGSILYGTTGFGGTSGDGTVFSVPITGGTPTVLASFNGNNGVRPSNNLVLLGNTLYGTTYRGGTGYNGTPNSGYGTVFSIDLTAVPEPASLLLLSLAAPFLLRRRPRQT
jgi:uncharacterized repeat protein (TIGR03803 family)